MKSNTVYFSYLIINKINGYIQQRNGLKYLMPAPTFESKITSKRGEKLWNKIRGLISSVINNTGNQDESYIKI